MAIYTPLTQQALSPIIASLGLGNIESLIGINEGIENSNFFLRTSRADRRSEHRDFVVTILERTPKLACDFYAQWLIALDDKALPVPRPLAVLTHEGKPMVIARRLPGRAMTVPSSDVSHAMGALIAQLHNASLSLALSPSIDNPRNLKWQQTILPTLKGHINVSDWQRANNAAQRLWPIAEAWHQNNRLPQAPIHADLFRDNVLVTPNPTGAEERISGVIDFYFGGVDWLLFDLAVAINDWCSPHAPAIIANLYEAMLGGYQSVRPLTTDERSALPSMLAFAALRFYLSRLADEAFPREGVVRAHHPKRFADILEARLTLMQADLR